MATLESVTTVEAGKCAAAAAIETQLQSAEAARKSIEARLAASRARTEEQRKEYFAMLEAK